MSLFPKLQSTSSGGSSGIPGTDTGAPPRLSVVSALISGNNEHKDYVYRTVGTTLVVERRIPFASRTLSLKEAGLSSHRNRSGPNPISAVMSPFSFIRSRRGPR